MRQVRTGVATPAVPPEMPPPKSRCWLRRRCHWACIALKSVRGGGPFDDKRCVDRLDDVGGSERAEDLDRAAAGQIERVAAGRADGVGRGAGVEADVVEIENRWSAQRRERDRRCNYWRADSQRAVSADAPGTADIQLAVVAQSAVVPLRVPRVGGSLSGAALGDKLHAVPRAATNAIRPITEAKRHVAAGTI